MKSLLLPILLKNVLRHVHHSQVTEKSGGGHRVGGGVAPARRCFHSYIPVRGKMVHK